MNTENTISIVNRFNYLFDFNKSYEISGYRPSIGDLREAVDQIIEFVNDVKVTPSTDKDFLSNIQKIRESHCFQKLARIKGKKGIEITSSENHDVVAVMVAKGNLAERAFTLHLGKNVIVFYHDTRDELRIFKKVHIVDIKDRKDLRRKISNFILYDRREVDEIIDVSVDGRKAKMRKNTQISEKAFRE